MDDRIEIAKSEDHDHNIGLYKISIKEAKGEDFSRFKIARDFYTEIINSAKFSDSERNELKNLFENFDKCYYKDCHEEYIKKDNLGAITEVNLSLCLLDSAEEETSGEPIVHPNTHELVYRRTGKIILPTFRINDQATNRLTKIEYNYCNNYVNRKAGEALAKLKAKFQEIRGENAYADYQKEDFTDAIPEKEEPLE